MGDLIVVSIGIIGIIAGICGIVIDTKEGKSGKWEEDQTNR